MKIIFLTLLFSCIFQNAFTLTPDPPKEQYIFFPGTNGRKFNLSLGMIFTTTHKDITEEIQFRIPAIDINATQKITKNFSILARLNSQILQNHFSLGLRWTNPFSKRLFLSVSDEMGFWEGWLKTEGFNTKAFGLTNYPAVSLGFRCGKDVLITMKAEALLNLSRKTFVGKNLTSSEFKFYNGEAVSIMLEQPFYHDKWFLLGFRAMYVNDFWQTWPLFETLDRNTFYPQLIMGFLI